MTEAAPAPASDPFGGARRRLSAAFTPTRPIEGHTFLDDAGEKPFVGRAAEISHVLDALLEDQAHVVLYGDRGRGKTSLANLAVGKMKLAGFDVARCVCSATSNYDSIMRNLFRTLPRWVGSAPGAADGKHDPAGALLPSQPLRPADILAVLGSLQWSRLVFVVDEFDRVTDDDARTAIADMIKQLSDRGMPLLFLIVGVSDSFEELFGRHPSIQRCVTRVALPLLGGDEIKQIVDGGARRAGMQFPDVAQECIAELARGMPYVAQLLSLRAGQAALRERRFEVQGRDLVAAIRAATVEADPRVIAAYDSLTRGETDAPALRVLRAAAVGRHDSFGRFKVSDDGDEVCLAGLPVDAGAWRRILEAGAIRRSVHGEADLFIFHESMLPHLVLQRAVMRHARCDMPFDAGEAA